MMMVVKKKQLVIAALAVVMGTAGYFGAKKGESAPTAQKYLGETQLVSSSDTADTDFFEQARIDREAGRSRSIETFNSLIENESADSEAKETAQRGMLTLAQNTETETAVENLLKARGFKDAVCYINGDMANIVVKTEALDAANAAVISEIVAEQSGISQDKIKIMEMN